MKNSSTASSSEQLLLPFIPVGCDCTIEDPVFFTQALGIHFSAATVCTPVSKPVNSGQSAIFQQDIGGYRVTLNPLTGAAYSLDIAP